MPPTDRKTGMPLPRGILTPTTPPEAEQGGHARNETTLTQRESHSRATEGIVSNDTPAREETPAEAKAPRTRKKRPPSNDKTEGRRLYLSEGVHFRLRMLAYQRKQKISEVAEDVLDKALPKWDVNRVG